MKDNPWARLLAYVTGLVNQALLLPNEYLAAENRILRARDLVIRMADRGISVTHTTILRWVQRYLPEFAKRWRRYARPVGGSWRMDETYIRFTDNGAYLYRAVDKAGQTLDFYLSRNRDVKGGPIGSAQRAMKNTGVPMKITWDAYAASHRAVREMQEDGELPGRVQVRT
jgi:transposase-like protein